MSGLKSLTKTPPERVDDVVDTYSGACTTRVYAFDHDSNRTSLASYPAASGGGCSTSTTRATVTSTYDAADRHYQETYDTPGPSQPRAGRRGHRHRLPQQRQDLTRSIPSTTTS